MKHLKRFNESKLMFDTNLLSEILQEITDLGYLSHVESSWWSNDRSNDISICIYGKVEYDKQLGCDVAYIYTDEIIEVVERLVQFLTSEGYKPDDVAKKSLEAIREKPIKKTKKEINIVTSRISQVRFRWDDNLQGYKICSSFSLDFRQE
jgi:hypothetical protein